MKPAAPQDKRNRPLQVLPCEHAGLTGVPDRNPMAGAKAAAPPLDEPPQDVRALLARQGLALPLYLDTERDHAARHAHQAWHLIQTRDDPGGA